MNRLPDGRLNPDDVFLTGIGWVHAQFAAEFPMIEMAMVARGLPIAPDFASLPTGQRIAGVPPWQGGRRLIPSPFALPPDVATWHADQMAVRG